MSKYIRGFVLTSPLMKGEDVEEYQKALNKQFRRFNYDRHILEDGQFGPGTLSASRQIGLSMGVAGRNARKLRKGRVTRMTQSLVGGRKRTVAERLASVRRRRFRKKLRKRLEPRPGVLVLTWAKQQVGVRENPPNSNWGPKIGKWIEFTGYTSPVYWCGCFACFAVVRIGGARIPNRIRLGFDGYIKADAANRDNGLTQVGFSEARAGDIVVYTFPHIGVVDHVVGDTISTVEGNTSSGPGGSQDNGGGVFQRTRSRGDVACIARPDY
jgi:hypothetical protein